MNKNISSNNMCCVEPEAALVEYRTRWPWGRCRHKWVWGACRPSRAGQTGPKGLVGQHNRPGLHWDNSCPYWQVFLDVNGAIDGLGPYGRVVGAIHYINLNVHRARQWREPTVLSYGGQPVRFSLCTVVERANIRVSTVSVFVDSLSYLREIFNGINKNILGKEKICRRLNCAQNYEKKRIVDYKQQRGYCRGCGC